MILVQSREQFDAAIDMLMKAEVIAVDTETYGRRGEALKHPAQGNRIVGISTHCVYPGDDRFAINFYFPFRHQIDDKVINLFTVSENLPIEWLPEFAKVLNRPDVKLVFHHLKFDAQMFRADKLWMEPNVSNVTDLLPKAQLINETMSHRLKDLGAMVFGQHVADEEAKIIEIVNKQGGYHKTTPQQMAPYACQDARLTHDLNEPIDAELERQQLKHLVRRETRFQLALMEMEWEGVKFDRDLAKTLSTMSRRRMRQIEDKLGFDPNKRDALAHVLFGDEATGGLGLPYTEVQKNKSKEFPQGVPSMNMDVLVNFRHPIVDLVLEYRGLIKADSTWYQGWINREGRDGRLHPTYNHSDKKAKFGTVTSRLSSYIQQMPRDPMAMVKLLLMPDEGNMLVEYDYAQIEYREAACYAKDHDLMEQFRAGVDTHMELAKQIGIDRQSAKQVVYTLLYGGQAPALAKNLMKQVWLNEKKIITVTIDEAKEILQAYYRVHPKILKVSKQAEAHARRHGYVALWNGRKRHFSSAEPWNFRKAFNSVLQGGAAQIICESMLMFHDMRKDVPFRQRIQVHDSLWFEIPETQFELCDAVIRQTMEWPSEKFGIPFPVDHKVIRRFELDDFQRALLGGRADRDLLSARSGGDDGLVAV